MLLVPEEQGPALCLYTQPYDFSPFPLRTAKRDNATYHVVKLKSAGNLQLVITFKKKAALSSLINLSIFYTPNISLLCSAFH